MREILFRGKSVDTNKWVYGYLFKIWEECYILWGTTNGVPNQTKINPKTISQFTGSVDDDNVMIYEGAILCFLDMHNSENGHSDFSNIGVVEYDDDSCCFYVTNKVCVEDDEIFNSGDDVKVIGNIHDNPELLEVAP